MGDTLRAEARAGTPAPGAPWEPSRVRDVALNPSYAGLRRHMPSYKGGHQPIVAPADCTPGNWPQIIAPADFWSVQGKLARPGRSTATGRGRQPQHLLSMIATCDVCAGPLSVRYKHGGTVAKLTCRDGSHVTIDRDALDAYVVDVITGLLSAPDAYAVMSAPADSAPELQGARDSLATAKAEHDELSRMVGAGKLSAILAASAEPAILARVDAASKRVAALEAPAGVAGLGLAPGPDIAARWQAAPLSARRAVVRALFSRISVKAVGRSGAGTPVEDRTEIVFAG
jgi:hypothetical protein